MMRPTIDELKAEIAYRHGNGHGRGASGHGGRRGRHDGFPDDDICEHPAPPDLYVSHRFWRFAISGIVWGVGTWLAVVGAATVLIWWLTD